ncbi:putative hydroxyethylthiazole kinase [Venturia nashicola]|uniref:Putative hydroxyethylthiazole kinase n=1 Tax=Venturia nashicola TaxID=86259 RepID=A0A4Z1NII0_9PEZI|nr:putative hydroxyethylthiazole kinase [Venturia nashicola]
MKVDYSLYLVTDSTGPILKGRNLLEIVHAAIQGGVTIVQFRKKTGDTKDLIREAKELHTITKAAGVPLLINDRVDVAIAVGYIATARKLLGQDAIIGMTASSIEEALRAAEDGADYLGLGTVFATPTKENAKSIVGCAGIRTFLEALAPRFPDLPTVCIGGVNTTNIQRVIYQCRTPNKQLSGVAIVSAIIAAPDPQQAANTLKSLLTKPPPFSRPTPESTATMPIDLDLLAVQVPLISQALFDAKSKPLCHNMTNMVVQNIAANVAICIGGSPIMSNNGAEAADLAKLGGSLVINMGTVTSEQIKNNLAALEAYNAAGGPVVLDPVGAGATSARREAVKTLVGGGHFDLIKGNEAEIRAVAAAIAPPSNGTSIKEDSQQKGVDSGPSTLSFQDQVKLVKTLALTLRSIVLMTGARDILSDGKRVVAIDNGHAYLGDITGSGCTLGTTTAAFLAVNREDGFMAVLTAVLCFEIAAERAAERVGGPGSFVPAWLDELYLIRTGKTDWWTAARVVDLSACIVLDDHEV